MLTTTLPSYAYQQYNDDPNIVAWFAAYNGTTISPALPIASISWAGGLVTVTTVTQVGVDLGQSFTVLISAVYPTGYNGQWLATVTNIDKTTIGYPTTFTYELTVDPTPATALGTWQQYPLQAGAQGYLDEANALFLPDYLVQTEPLLDWIGNSLYGQPRTDLQSTPPLTSGPYNTIIINGNAGTTLFPLNTIKRINQGTSVIVTDQAYKRIIQWNNYKGDGFQFTVRWLKRRVQRFIFGAAIYSDVTTPNWDQTYQVSVTFTDTYEVKITLSGVYNNQLATILQAAISSAVVLLPFQYTFTVDLT